MSLPKDVFTAYLKSGYLPGLCIDHDPFFFLSFLFLSFLFLLFLFLLFLFLVFSFYHISLSRFYSVSILIFFFLYHLSLLLPRSHFLSIGSPIHLCFILSLSRCLMTRLRYKLMPHLCFPCAFLPSGPDASHAPFPIFRHFCLCCVPLHCYLLFCPLQALCLDIKNPLPGSLI